jgi:hypothetical protein
MTQRLSVGYHEPGYLLDFIGDVAFGSDHNHVGIKGILVPCKTRQRIAGYLDLRALLYVL